MSRYFVSTMLVVAKDEWRYWLRSKLAKTVLIIGLLLTLSSAVVTAFNMLEASHERVSLQHKAEQTFIDQPDRHPHRMVHYGHYVFRAPSALSIIDPGIDSYTGNSIFLEGHRQNSTMFAEQKQSTGLTQLGNLSPAFVVQVLAPLLLILIGYSAISRERESQTLAFLLSQGTTVFTLIMGKGLALSLVVFLIILPLIFSGILAVFQGESWFVVFSFLLNYVLYLLIWVLLVLLVSTLFAKNNASFTGLTFIWIVFCIVMPRVASSTAAATVPLAGKLETDFAVIAELHKLGDGHNASDPAFNALKTSLLKQYNVNTLDELPINFRGVVASAAEADLTKVLNKFAEQQMSNELKQTHIARRFGWLSPMVAIRSFSMISAGTSIETHHRFMREAETLRFHFVQSLNAAHKEQLSYSDDIKRNLNDETWKKARVSSDNWQMINDFSFEMERANIRLQRSALSFWQLLCWLGVLVFIIKMLGGRLK